MHTVSKKTLSESDICDQCITPAIVAAGWNMSTQIRREFSFTAGRIIVRGQLAVHWWCADIQPRYEAGDCDGVFWEITAPLKGSCTSSLDNPWLFR